MGEDSVRLCERTSGRHDVVQHEATLIHLWQEVRSKASVGKERAGDQNTAQTEEQQRLAESPIQGASMPCENEVHPTAMLTFLCRTLGVPGCDPIFQQPHTETRCPCEGENQRGEKC